MAIRELSLPATLESKLLESKLLESKLLKSKLRTARELVPDRRRGSEERLATGSTALDQLLRGGLARGTMLELVGGASSGRFSLALAPLAAATASGEAAALIDLGDGLDPQAASDLGIDLARLLWLRPRTTKEALGGAEAALACGMGLVVLDLGLPPITGGRGAEASWLRLARAARARRAALLISSPYRASGTAPDVVLRLQEGRAVWYPEHVARAGAPPLLRAVQGEVVLRKDRGPGRRRPGATASLRLDAPDACRSTAGDLVDSGARSTVVSQEPARGQAVA